MISLENYEEYMMLHADGELQPAEEHELMTFLDTHPELKNEMAAYELTRLSPDETLTYNDKNSLLREEPAKRIIAFPQWGKYAIAASVAALILFSFFKYAEINKNTSEIAKADTVKTILTAPANNAQVQTNPKPQQVPQNIAAAPVHPHKALPIIHHEEQLAINNKQGRNKKQTDAATENNTATATRTTTEISSLSMADTKLLPCAANLALPPVAIIPTYEISTYSKPGKRSLIDRLPIDEANKRQLKTIAHITSGASRSAGKVKEEIEVKEITFNIKNNNIHISL